MVCGQQSLPLLFSWSSSAIGLCGKANPQCEEKIKDSRDHCNLDLRGPGCGPVVLQCSPPSLSLTPLRVGHLVADELHQPGWCVAEERGFIRAEGFRAIHSEYIHGPQEMEHFGWGT